jgi:hypothetical protein
MQRRRFRCGSLAAVILAVGALAGRAAADTDLTALADQVFQLVNQQRATRGVKPLVRMSPLDRSAQEFAGRMAAEDFFAHIAPDGSTPWDRIHGAGYQGSGWGENIAAGLDTANEVMDAWMKSPGHAANILDANYTQIGIGVAVGGSYGIYWVQDFGTPLGTEPGPWTPHLDTVSPSAAKPGDMVTLNGTDLGSPGGVTFNGVPAAIEQWGTRQVVARVPASGGFGPVVVTNSYGASNGLSFGTPTPPPVNTPPSTPGPTAPPPPSTPPATPTPTPPANTPPTTPSTPTPPTVPVTTPVTPTPPSTPTPPTVPVTTPVTPPPTVPTTAPDPTPTAPTPSPIVTPLPPAVGLRFFYQSPRNGASGSVVHLYGAGFGTTAGQIQMAGATATVLSWSDTEIVLRVESARLGRRGLRIVRADGRAGPVIAFRFVQ